MESPNEDEFVQRDLENSDSPSFESSSGSAVKNELIQMKTEDYELYDEKSIEQTTTSIEPVPNETYQTKDVAGSYEHKWNKVESDSSDFDVKEEGIELDASLIKSEAVETKNDFKLYEVKKDDEFKVALQMKPEPINERQFLVELDEEESPSTQPTVLTESLERARSDPISDEFDIKPFEECVVDNPQNWESNNECSPERIVTPIEVNITPAKASFVAGKCGDELADIQERLSSFHSENLMILQSRNKKQSRNTTPTMDDDCSGGPSRNGSPERCVPTGNLESASKKRKKGKQLNFEGPTEDQINPKEFASVEDTSALGPSKIDAPQYSNFLLHTNPEAVAAVTFNINQPPPPPPQVQQKPATITCDPDLLTSASLAAALPPPPPPPLPTPIQNTSFFNQFPEVVSQLPAVVAGKSLLSEYLENPNKPTSFSSQTFSSPIPTHSMFNVAIPSFSILDDPANSSVNANPTPSPTLSALTTCPKIVTRTQSNDPRLNPSLTVPVVPSAPKRKLSINEYRKRKQQSTGSSEKNTGATKSGSSLKQSGMGANLAANYPSMLAMPTCLSLDNQDSSSPKLNGSSSMLSQSPDDKITGIYIISLFCILQIIIMQFVTCCVQSLVQHRLCSSCSKKTCRNVLRITKACMV